MATLALGTDLTVMELIRREDPDGKLAELIDIIAQENRILEDITWIECNNGTYHEDTQTVSEPAGTERAYDEGVSKEAGVTQKVTEPTCMLNGISEVDAAKFLHSADPDGARLQEDSFFLKGMTKTLVSRLFDGDRSSDIRRINGINTRTDYNTLQTAGSETRVFDNAGGSCADASTFTSVYFVQWGHKKVNCIYPRNDPQGGGVLPIKMEDFGKSIISQSVTAGHVAKKYPAWQTWFSCDFGLFIADPRCIKRVVNIATTGINETSYFAFHEDAMIDAWNQLEYNGVGCSIYCNRTLLAQAQKRSNEKGNGFFTESQGEGPFAHPVTYWNGIELKRVDQITNVQADVTT